jgi:hypothetical protein
MGITSFSFRYLNKNSPTASAWVRDDCMLKVQEDTEWSVGWVHGDIRAFGVDERALSSQVSIITATKLRLNLNLNFLHVILSLRNPFHLTKNFHKD